MHLKILCIGFFLLCLMGCERIALINTPAKTPEIASDPQTQQVQDNFWLVLHHGQYDKIPATIEALTAAYLTHPNDPNLAAHLGFLHIWLIAERQRLNKIPPTIVDEMILSRKYFTDGVALAPDDARFLGFLGTITLGEGAIFADKREQVKGYFILKEAISAWPQFNYFTAGYPMSILPRETSQFQEALEWQWKTLDVCAHTTISRSEPDFSPYMKLNILHGLDRACWNSEIAPFNFEGFFLNMGDMLVKNGDWQTAIKIYNNAKLASNYSGWPYREVLEKRIINAEKNKDNFILTSDFMTQEKDADKTIAFNAKFSCMMCHQTGTEG